MSKLTACKWQKIVLTWKERTWIPFAIRMQLPERIFLNALIYWCTYVINGKLIDNGPTACAKLVKLLPGFPCSINTGITNSPTCWSGSFRSNVKRDLSTTVQNRSKRVHLWSPHDWPTSGWCTSMPLLSSTVRLITEPKT